MEGPTASRRQSQRVRWSDRVRWRGQRGWEALRDRVGRGGRFRAVEGRERGRCNFFGNPFIAASLSGNTVYLAAENRYESRDKILVVSLNGGDGSVIWRTRYVGAGLGASPALSPSVTMGPTSSSPEIRAVTGRTSLLSERSSSTRPMAIFAGRTLSAATDTTTPLTSQRVPMAASTLPVKAIAQAGGQTSRPSNTSDLISLALVPDACSQQILETQFGTRNMPTSTARSVRSSSQSIQDLGPSARPCDAGSRQPFDPKNPKHDASRSMRQVLERERGHAERRPGAAIRPIEQGRSAPTVGTGRGLRGRRPEVPPEPVLPQCTRRVRGELRPRRREPAEG